MECFVRKDKRSGKGFLVVEGDIIFQMFKRRVSSTMYMYN